jgi:hypothetical protein
LKRHKPHGGENGRHHVDVDLANRIGIVGAGAQIIPRVTREVLMRAGATSTSCHRRMSCSPKIRASRLVQAGGGLRLSLTAAGAVHSLMLDRRALARALDPATNWPRVRAVSGR